MKWKNFGPNEVTWEMEDQMQVMYPSSFLVKAKKLQYVVVVYSLWWFGICVMVVWYMLYCVLIYDLI